MINLREMKVDDLKDIARKHGIVGAWKMTKDKLIESIIKNAELNGHHDYCDSQNDSEVTETETNETTQETEQNESDNDSERESEVVEEKKKSKRNLIEFNGKSQTLGGWAKEFNIAGQTLYYWINMKHMSVEDAFAKAIARKGGDNK